MANTIIIHTHFTWLHTVKWSFATATAASVAAFDSCCYNKCVQTYHRFNCLMVSTDAYDFPSSVTHTYFLSCFLSAIVQRPWNTVRAKHFLQCCKITKKKNIEKNLNSSRWQRWLGGKAKSSFMDIEIRCPAYCAYLIQFHYYTTSFDGDRL